MENTVELPVQIRAAGKGPARSLRQQKLTPGVIYGKNSKNFEVALDERLLEKYATLGHDNQIFKVVTDHPEVNGMTIVIKLVDRHPVSRRFVHVDFQVVEKGRKFRKDVRIDFVGTPKGVKEGGAFQVTRRRVRLECTPENLPEVLRIDVTELNVKDNFSAGDIPIPEGARLVTRPEITVCVCAK